MTRAVMLITALAAALWACTALGLLLEVIGRRRSRADALLQQKYVLTLCGYLDSAQAGCGDAFPFPGRVCRRSAMLLAEAIAAYVSVSCSFDFGLLRKIVIFNGVDTMLLRRIRRSRSWRRVRFLQLLSQTGARDEVAAQVQRYCRARNPLEALFALLVRVASAPERTVAEIRSFPGQLPEAAYGQILMLLRRGLVPVAYEPMLRSTDENLQMLGIAIVSHFGIVEAEPVLRNMLDDAEPAVADAALYALARLKCSMSGRSVVECAAAMSFFRRRRFYRFLAAEGYSTAALEALQKAESSSALNGYVQEMVKSYKMTLG